MVEARYVTAVAVAALTEDSPEQQAYAVTGPAAVAHAELAAAFGGATGRTVRFEPAPPADFAADHAQRCCAALRIKRDRRLTR